MIDRNIVEQAYCFFHQKWNVYAGKSSEKQRDDIEYAISCYADTMSPELFRVISAGKPDFLHDHSAFHTDMTAAIDLMSSYLEAGVLRYRLSPEVDAFSSLRDHDLPYPVTQAHQVHGVAIAKIDRPGVTREELQGYDALITNVRGCAIGARTADCIPVLMYDPVNKAAAAVHSGWRGTVQRISSVVVKEMAKTYGTDPENLIAVIGPGIGPDSFQVGPEVVNAFQYAGFCMDKIWEDRGEALHDGSMRGGHHINLWEACRQTLVDAGLKPENIQLPGICTYISPDFYSARREGLESGRIINTIKIL